MGPRRAAASKSGRAVPTSAMSGGPRIPTGILRRLLEAQPREREVIVTELVQVKGLMPLLMKHRNGSRWSREERRQLRQQFNALMGLSPYLFVMALPGSVLFLPALAWWLDRRRQRRH